MSAYRQSRIPTLKNALGRHDMRPEDLANVKRQIADNQWHLTLLHYSGGTALQDVAVLAVQAIESPSHWIDDDHASLDLVDLSIQDSYTEALWLVSLVKLLGLGGQQIERIANLYAADETNDGADELFEELLGKLGRKSFPAEGLIHEDPYQLLLDCIKSDAAQRPALMTAFLKRWFKGQKECDWWGSHVPRKGTTVLDTGFFGYWAFEAALVTFLWDIDDASYRDLPYYLKDLIDYARQHATPTEAKPVRVERRRANPALKMAGGQRPRVPTRGDTSKPEKRCRI